MFVMKTSVFVMLAVCVVLAFAEDVCRDIDGNTFSPGDSFSVDGCNRCICGPNGQYACTRMACRNVCYRNNRYYRAGTNFQDDCNTCTCGGDGYVSCTQALCK